MCVCGEELQQKYGTIRPLGPHTSKRIHIHPRDSRVTTDLLSEGTLRPLIERALRYVEFLRLPSFRGREQTGVLVGVERNIRTQTFLWLFGKGALGTRT